MKQVEMEEEMDNQKSRYLEEDLLEKVDSTEIDLEVETELEVELNEDDKRKLYVDKVDKSTSDLFRMIFEGELNLQPDYQRRFVWNKKLCLSLLNLCYCQYQFRLFFWQKMLMIHLKLLMVNNV